MDILLEIFTIIGIISFSAAGAMVAIDKETDFFGVIFLSVITCFGGGMLRDIIAGATIEEKIPAFFQSEDNMPLYVIISVATAIVVFFVAMIFKRKYVREEKLVCDINNVLDALGIGVFSAAGTAMYLSQGPFVAIILGMISSVGGSLTRDIMLRDIPFFLRKRIYAMATLAGSAVYYLIAAVIMPGKESADVVATVACIVVIFALRICATAFKWNMPKAIDFSKMKEESSDAGEVKDAEAQLKQ